MKINKKLQEAMKSPPPERLARIEYQSHFLQMIGISAVCIFLIIKGLWYIIFAFIFGVGVSYSQGMNAYNKYMTIVSLKSPEKLSDLEKDISPSRKRHKIITKVMGTFPRWATIVLSVGGTVILIDPTFSRWVLMAVYPLTMLTIYVFVYFFLFYWIAYPIYKKQLRDERRLKNNGKEKI